MKIILSLLYLAFAAYLCWSLCVAAAKQPPLYLDDEQPDIPPTGNRRGHRLARWLALSSSLWRVY